MNYKKIWRKIERGDEFKPSDALHVRRAIAKSLEVFFEKLKKLREDEAKGPQE